MKKLIAMIALAAAGCSPKFGLFRPKSVDLLDPARRTVAIATTNRFSSSWLAATELTNYIAKVTGKEVEISGKAGSMNPPRSAHRADPTIVIGTLADLGEAAPDEARKALAATDNFEAAWTGVRDGKLWIVGKDETAELYATYRFIEKHLGVRWFMSPTKDDPGEYVPHLDSLLIPEGYTELNGPKFRVRRLDVSSQWGVQYPPLKSGACAVRNGMQICPAYNSPIPSETDKWFQPARRFYLQRCQKRILPFGNDNHTTFTAGVPGKIWHKDHPEYFPLVKGKRVRNAMYCLSNPGTASVLADSIIRDYEKAGCRGRFIFGQVDKEDGQCECAACRALDTQHDGVGAGLDTSGRFQTCVMRAAKKIWEKYPDCDLRTWAYSTYRRFPEKVAFDPRIKVEYCTHGRCYGHAIDDPACSRNKPIWADMKKWAAHTKVCNTYEYYTCTAPYYSCHEIGEAHDIKAYDAIGINGWKNEWQFSDGKWIPEPKPGAACLEVAPSNWQWLYVTAKLLWDPSLDPEAVLADVEEKYYGPAYPAMKKYQQLRRALWENAEQCMGYPWGDGRTPQILNAPGAEEKLLALLDEADRLAEADASSRRPYQSGRAGSMNPPPTQNANSIYKYRVARDRQWLERFWINPRKDAKKFRPQLITHIRPAFLKTPVTVDGKADEAAWQDENGYSFRDTTAAFRTDMTNLYVLVRAKETDKLRAGDGVELWLRPPVAETNAVRCSFVWDGERTKVENGGLLSPVSCLSSSSAGWAMEIKVPLKAVHPVRIGDTWLVSIARLRPNRAGEPALFALDGATYGDQSKYRPMPFGEGFVGNGDFSVQGAWKKEAVGWYTSPENGLPACGGAQFPGMFYKYIDHGALAVNGRTRPFRYRLMAQGKGKVTVSRFCYDHSPVGGGKLYKNPKDGIHPLNGTMQLFEGRVEIDPWERTIFIVSSSDPVALKWIEIYPESVSAENPVTQIEDVVAEAEKAIAAGQASLTNRVALTNYVSRVRKTPAGEVWTAALQTLGYVIGHKPEWAEVGRGGNIHFEDIDIDLNDGNSTGKGTIGELVRK